MNRVFLTFLTLGLFIAISCKIEPQPINYGKDQCHFCKMNIVDQQHAAQYVTKKGKQFKFDAIECMLNDLAEKNKTEISIFLVSDYGNPGTMTDAQIATYLISKEIKSPMGAFLSAFSNKETALETLQTNGGKIYSWSAIKEKYAVK